MGVIKIEIVVYCVFIDKILLLIRTKRTSCLSVAIYKRRSEVFVLSFRII